MVTSRNPLNDVFVCPEESNFYSYCLESLILEKCKSSEIILEFGSGDGTPIINALLRTNFNGLICGYELNSTACKMAKYHIKERSLNNNYTVHNTSFFDSPKPIAQYLISNPPYLPALDSNLYQPLLHGGRDGAGIAKQLLLLGYENVLLMVSSYSNPVGLIDFALSQGYYVDSFLVSPLTFGYYSSESKVIKRIGDLRAKNKAFYSQKIYLLAGVLFKQQHNNMVDISSELIKVMTSL